MNCNELLTGMMKNPFSGFEGGERARFATPELHICVLARLKPGRRWNGRRVALYEKNRA